MSEAQPPVLWATASKEWVIQPKPKPGRKPKKDTLQGPSTDDKSLEADSKERRIQNRAAQRAFRERKQSQLAELQAKIQKYEQGEIERSVALQNIAKKLKAENDALREENLRLAAKLKAVEERDEVSPTPKGGSSSRKRPRATVPAFHSSDSDTLPNKKAKVVATAQETFSSSLSSPEPSDADHLSFATPPPTNLSYPVVAVQDDTSQGRSWPSLDCGLCSDNTPCACRELGLRDSISTSLEFAKDSFERFVPESASPFSLIDNPPSFQPAVPLRRRSQRTGGANKLFPVSPFVDAEGREQSATCSGDPENCLACADDSFGKAFCTALSETTRCSDCPEGCHRAGTVKAERANDRFMPPAPPLPTSSEHSTSVPTSEAWRQLKSHPNVQFADLAMLADVVSRKSHRCAGPVASTSRAEAPDTSAGGSGNSGAVGSTAMASSSSVEAQASPSFSRDKPVLAPQEVLLQCNKAPLCTVDATGVRDALRLLDSKFSRTWD